MSSLRRIKAILKKQVKDTLKNKAILIQFVMFPVMTIIMTNAVQIKGMPENYFVNLFATMYVGMAPLICMSNILSEEKENNTLRILLMSNVNAVEYLLGVGIYIVLVAMIGSCVMASQGHLSVDEFAFFLFAMFVGIVISTMLGAVIGIVSKNQMSATSLSVPLMMVFAFLPMLGAYNKTIAKVSKFVYSQQIDNLLSNVHTKTLSAEGTIILVVNAIVILGIFGACFRRRGIEDSM